MIIPVDIHTHRRPQVPGTAIVNCFPESFVPQTEGWYSVGIHPWYIASFAASLNDSKARFEELLDHPQVLAVGEAGLDKLAEAPLTLQIEVFEYQARLAEEANKPLIIHLVKAVDELLKLKQKIQLRQKTLRRSRQRKTNLPLHRIHQKPAMMLHLCHL